MTATAWVIAALSTAVYGAVAVLVARRAAAYAPERHAVRAWLAGLLWPVTMTLWHYGFALGLRDMDGTPLGERPERRRDGPR